MEKRYYLMLLLPAMVLALYFSTQQYFWSSPGKSGDTENRVMHAELKVLSLLKQQESNMLSLYNGTSNMTRLDDVQTVVLEELRLNQEIQQTLLAGYGTWVGSSVNTLSAQQGPNCKKVFPQKKNAQRELVWVPKSNNFLLAICVSGQFSNRLICIEKHMFYAALLNRTLVLPNRKHEVWSYDMENTLDIGHIQSCVGNTTVITFEQFEVARNKSIHVNRFICYFRRCYLDPDKQKQLKSSGMTWSHWEDAWPEDPALSGDHIPSHPHLKDFLSKFAVEDEVIAIGDVFYADVEDQWQQQLGGPISHPACGAILQPSRTIVLTAQRFIQTYLGNNFLSFHFRRHGWLVFCNTNPEDCFFPIPQAANCILRKLKAANSSVVFVSSDAARSEVDLLKAMLTEDGRPTPIVTRQEHDPQVKWDSLLVKHKPPLHKSPEVMGMLDKTIHALASTFVGTAGSTFTEDINRLRHLWGTASSCDEYLCQGEKPNFRAELT